MKKKAVLLLCLLQQQSSAFDMNWFWAKGRQITQYIETRKSSLLQKMYAYASYMFQKTEKISEPVKKDSAKAYLEKHDPRYILSQKTYEEIFYENLTLRAAMGYLKNETLCKMNAMQKYEATIQAQQEELQTQAQTIQQMTNRLLAAYSEKEYMQDQAEVLEDKIGDLEKENGVFITVVNELKDQCDALKNGFSVLYQERDRLKKAQCVCQNMETILKYHQERYSKLELTLLKLEVALKRERNEKIFSIKK